MNAPARRTAASTTRRAWAVSVSLHGLGLAAALAVGGAATTHASWSATTSTPMVSSLRIDRPEPIAEVTLEPAASVELATVAEAPPPQFEPLVDPLVGPSSPSFDDDSDVRQAEPTRPQPRPRPTVQWLAKIGTSKATPPRTPAASAAAGAFVQPSPLHSDNEPPAYPLVAWKRGIEGQVAVLLEIDERGAVTAAHVETSSGCSQLDDAALQKLATWRFEPARRAGRAVRGTWRQVVVFQLTS